ncbi:hypothetical protein ACMFMG_007626 [Clarireedia jacksonii]
MRWDVVVVAVEGVEQYSRELFRTATVAATAARTAAEARAYECTFGRKGTYMMAWARKYYKRGNGRRYWGLGLWVGTGFEGRSGGAMGELVSAVGTGVVVGDY